VVEVLTHTLTINPHVKTKSMFFRPLLYLDRPPKKEWLFSGEIVVLETG